MALLLFLRILAVATAAFCLAALTFLVVRTRAAGKNVFFSAPRGNARRGIVYAFGHGMMPWEKESASLHWPTFWGGIFYHGAIFLSILYIFWVIFLPALARPLWILRVIFAVGAASGMPLLVKRITKPHLRRLSCPDDFFANLLVDLFLVVSILHTFHPELEPVMLLYAAVLFVYIPLGKIRHCFFFFYTRILFGVFFGRRGVFPHSTPRA